MKRVLILGSTGFLGNILLKFLKKNFVVFSDRSFKKKLKKCSNDEFFNEVILQKNPDIILNLVALTDVDKCEKNKKKALNSNCTFVKNLVVAIKKNKKKRIHLIHISTDQVYSGDGNHRENKTNPINFYGKSKLKGEKFIRKTPYTIFRTNFIGIGASKKNNLSKWIINNLKKKNKIQTFKNIIFSPIHTSTLVDIVMKAISQKNLGTYNVGSKDKISKSEFAKKIAKYLKISNKLLEEVNYEKVKLLAKRPKDMSLNCDRFERKFKYKLPYVDNEIQKLIKEAKIR